MSSNPTLDAYEKYAEIYDREVIDFWKNFPREFVTDFRDLTPGKRVLNLGSGSGRDALLLRETGMEVFCVDGSSTMTRITNTLGFESLVSTFDELELEPNSFDGVWAYTSLLHLPKSELAETLARIHGWLRQDGAFALGMIEGDGERDVVRDSMPGESRLFAYYSSDELISRAGEAGFEFISQVDYQPRNSKYLNQLFRKV